MTKRVVIEQGRLQHYRVPFFEALAGRLDSLTVVHSGTRTENVGFEEAIVRQWSAGGIHLQPGLSTAIGNADTLVVMFDLHWPFNIKETMLSPDGRRCLLWGHGLGRNRLLWPLRLEWIRRSDGVILYHKKQVRELVRLGIPNEKIFVAPNTVVLPKSQSSAGKRDSVLFVGRLQARKRIDVLVDAFAWLKTSGMYPSLRLDLVGDGKERSVLEERVERLELKSDVHFHGAVFDESKLSELYARAVVYASPGWTGLGLLHAFAHGVPAVVGDDVEHAPEVQDLIPGVNGLRARIDPQSFGEGLETIVSDPLLRDRMGKAAEHFMHRERRIENMVDGFMEALS